ncbi:MAG: cytochrome c [Deltaproteobacteria bacterium]|nr:cytochrome c [Deltaproteobacteria bacterium]
MTKCNACHRDGGMGPPIDAGMAPSFLERGKTSGRHGVPENEFDNLIAYLNQRYGAPAAVATNPATGAPVAAPVVVAAAASTGDPARGERYFQAKCNRCHPNGARGVGPAVIGAPVPGPLKSAATGGRHDVAPDEYDGLVAYLQKLGGGAAAAPVAAATPVAAPVAAAPVAAAAPATGDPAAGATYWTAKCNKCHPGGNKGVGPAVGGKILPGPLKPAMGGRHDVAPDQFENVLAYLTTLGSIRTGSVATAAPAATPAPTGTAPVATPAAATGSGIPINAGMVPCTCNCQCPAGAPPNALPAACICQCTCPR